LLGLQIKPCFRECRSRSRDLGFGRRLHRAFGAWLTGIKKPRHSVWAGAWVWRLAIPYFRMANCHTIIGAKRFHFRVRDGIGWFTLAMVTKQTGVVGHPHCHWAALGWPRAFALRLPFAAAWKSVHSLRFASPTNLNTKLIGCYRVKPHGQLVHVSYIHYWTSTPCLSTS
jgi:hypothetical protein